MQSPTHYLNVQQNLGLRVTCPMSVLQDEQTFLINFNLINERYLAIRVVRDAKCHMITISRWSPRSLWDCGWLAPVPVCLVSGHGVWQKSVNFQNVGRCPQLALVYFLSLQNLCRQSFAFPYKSNLRNALLHSRSLDRLLVKVAQKEKHSIEPTDSSDSIGDSESHPIH